MPPVTVSEEVDAQIKAMSVEGEPVPRPALVSWLNSLRTMIAFAQEDSDHMEREIEALRAKLHAPQSDDFAVCGAKHAGAGSARCIRPQDHEGEHSDGTFDFSEAL